MEEPKKKATPFLHTLTNFVLFIVGLLALFSGAWSLFNDPPSAAVTKIATGLFLLMAATIDRFESLKALGMEAKTKKLDEKIEEADEILKRVRQLTELSGKALIGLYAKVGRYSAAPSPLEMTAFGRDVRSVMSAIGVDASTIKTSLSPWVWALCIDMVHGYWSTLSRVASEKKQTLERERATLVREDGGIDARYLELRDQIQVLEDFLVSRNYQNWWDSLNAENIGGSLRTMFQNLPATLGDLTQLREEAHRSAAEMDVFLRTTELQNEGAWVVQLNRFRTMV